MLEEETIINGLSNDNAEKLSLINEKARDLYDEGCSLYVVMQVLNDKELSIFHKFYIEGLRGKENAKLYLKMGGLIEWLWEDGFKDTTYEFVKEAIEEGWKITYDDIYELLVDTKNKHFLDFIKYIPNLSQKKINMLKGILN